ncbi:protein kinase domain-containing protein [Sorangium sp. So ce513]|uniref:serine/threonine-protein kinase n=1 Tax=Sorangium sp. So ce513 TaxID=3133315 RepID=UPI003F61E7AD
MERRDDRLGESGRCHKYRLVKLIAEGGMGRVYEAVDEYLDRTVALKVVRPERMSDADFLRGHRKEARVLADLNHPNIVRLYDAGVTGDGVMYIAMEHVDGVSLRQMLHAMRRFDARVALSIAIQVVDAIRVAHEGGIVHRDLKPENVLVMQSGLVKVVDFGLARRVGGLASSDVFSDLGTVHYMAPEQALRRPVGRPADIYAAGLILYEMLAGKHAFAERTGELPPRQEVWANHVHAVPAPLADAIPEGAPRSLSDLVARMLAKSPDERPGANEAFDALTREFDGCSEQPPQAEGQLVLDPKVRASIPSLRLVPAAEAVHIATAPLDAAYRPPGAVLPFLSPAPSRDERRAQELLTEGAGTAAAGTAPDAAAARAPRWLTTERMPSAPPAPPAAAPSEPPVAWPAAPLAVRTLHPVTGPLPPEKSAAAPSESDAAAPTGAREGAPSEAVSAPLSAPALAPRPPPGALPMRLERETPATARRSSPREDGAGGASSQVAAGTRRKRRVGLAVGAGALCCALSALWVVPRRTSLVEAPRGGAVLSPSATEDALPSPVGSPVPPGAPSLVGVLGAPTPVDGALDPAARPPEAAETAVSQPVAFDAAPRPTAQPPAAQAELGVAGPAKVLSKAQAGIAPRSAASAARPTTKASRAARMPQESDPWAWAEEEEKLMKGKLHSKTAPPTRPPASSAPPPAPAASRRAPAPPRPF